MLNLLLLTVATVTAAPAIDTNDQAHSPFEAAREVDDEELSKLRAREDLVQIANSEQVASVSDSSVSGDVDTGASTFSDSFQNVSGLTVVNANTGNNVAINGSIVVNISITPQQ